MEERRYLAQFIIKIDHYFVYRTFSEVLGSTFGMILLGRRVVARLDWERSFNEEIPKGLLLRYPKLFVDGLNASTLNGSHDIVRLSLYDCRVCS